MNIKKIISKLTPVALKQLILQSLIKFNYKNISFGDNVKINKETKMEGCNSIDTNSDISNSYIGLGSYIASNSRIINTKIGKFCAIGSNVRTGLGRHPVKNFISIHPCFYSLKKQAGFSFASEQLFEEHIYVDNIKHYCVEIGSDVWIGDNVLIMDGISISDGAVIAAGSVVVKNVEPYSIVGGLPGKEIKKRFNESQIKKLVNMQWWNWPFKKIQKNHDLFNNVSKFLEKER